MSSPLPSDAEVIALAGDWHANLVVALEQIDRAHAAGADLIIQLGDLGYGTPVTNNRRYLVRMERKLTALDMHLFWIDGNHDDHARLDAKRIDPDTGLRHISPTSITCRAACGGSSATTHGWRWAGLSASTRSASGKGSTGGPRRD